MREMNGINDLLDALELITWHETPANVPREFFTPGMSWRGLFSMAGDMGGGGTLFPLFPEISGLSDIRAYPSVSFRHESLRSLVFHIHGQDQISLASYRDLAMRIFHAASHRFGGAKLRNVGLLSGSPDVQVTWQGARSTYGLDAHPKTRRISIGGIPLDGELHQIICGRLYTAEDFREYRAA